MSQALLPQQQLQVNVTAQGDVVLLQVQPPPLTSLILRPTPGVFL